ncbi:MAG: hypothetical protein RLZZ254_228 [Actinomycetota bacterium]|jgi:hypothetical protein
MKLDRARAEGERVVIELLRKFRQDTGNAKWIGRMAIGPLEQRLASFKNAGIPESGDLESDTPESVRVPLDETHPTSQNSSSDPVSRWSILSASELVDYLATCDLEDAAAILREEREKLGRLAVIDAALRRLG